MEGQLCGKDQMQKIVVLLYNSKGGDTRKKILEILSSGPKNCNQLSKNLKISWWAVKKHLSLLIKYNLIEEIHIEKTIFYELTKLGFIALRRLQSNYFLTET